MLTGKAEHATGEGGNRLHTSFRDKAQKPETRNGHLRHHEAAGIAPRTPIATGVGRSDLVAPCRVFDFRFYAG